MSGNGYFHQNKAISAIIQAGFLYFCMSQINKSVIVLWMHFLSIQESDKNRVSAKFKRHFIVRLIFDR